MIVGAAPQVPFPRWLALLALLTGAAALRPELSLASSSRGKTYRIGIIYAMEAEAAPTLALLNIPLSQQPVVERSPLPARKYTGTYSVGDDTLDVTIVVLGKQKMSSGTVDRVGTVSAAMATVVLLESSSPPQLIINAGTGGGFGKRETTGGTVSSIGDVFLASAYAYHDRRIPFGAAYEEYGKNLRSASGDVLAVRHDLPKHDQFSWKSGIVSTGNSLDTTDADLKILAQNRASVKEMEAAAIAEVAEMYQTPFAALKSVTDIVDGPKATGEEFGENLHMASTNLATAMRQFLALVPSILDS